MVKRNKKREKVRNVIRKKLSGKIDIYIYFFFEVEKKNENNESQWGKKSERNRKR